MTFQYFRPSDECSKKFWRQVYKYIYLIWHSLPLGILSTHDWLLWRMTNMHCCQSSWLREALWSYAISWPEAEKIDPAAFVSFAVAPRMILCVCVCDCKTFSRIQEVSRHSCRLTPLTVCIFLYRVLFLLVLWAHMFIYVTSQVLLSAVRVRTHEGRYAYLSWRKGQVAQPGSSLVWMGSSDGSSVPRWCGRPHVLGFLVK